MQDTEQLRAEGGRIRHVRLESELRGILSAAGETAPPSSRGRTRPAWPAARRAAASVWPSSSGTSRCPDALIEIEDAQGRVLVRGIEGGVELLTPVPRCEPSAWPVSGCIPCRGFRRQERQRRIGTFVNGRFGLTETGQVVDHKMYGGS